MLEFVFLVSLLALLAGDLFVDLSLLLSGVGALEWKVMRKLALRNTALRNARSHSSYSPINLQDPEWEIGCLGTCGERSYIPGDSPSAALPTVREHITGYQMLRSQLVGLDVGGGEDLQESAELPPLVVEHKALHTKEEVEPKLQKVRSLSGLGFTPLLLSATSPARSSALCWSFRCIPAACIHAAPAMLVAASCSMQVALARKARGLQLRLNSLKLRLPLRNAILDEEDRVLEVGCLRSRVSLAGPLQVA